MMQKTVRMMVFVRYVVMCTVVIHLMWIVQLGEAGAACIIFEQFAAQLQPVSRYTQASYNNSNFLY